MVFTSAIHNEYIDTFEVESRVKVVIIFIFLVYMTCNCSKVSDTLMNKFEREQVLNLLLKLSTDFSASCA